MCYAAGVLNAWERPAGDKVTSASRSSISSSARRNQLKPEAAALHHTQLGFLLSTKCSLVSGTELSPPKVTELRKGIEAMNLNYVIQHTRVGQLVDS